MKAFEWINEAANNEALEQLFRRAVNINIEKGEKLTEVHFTFKLFSFTNLVLDAITNSFINELAIYTIYSIGEGYTHLTISISN
jgi:hypothetical protein